MGSHLPDELWRLVLESCDYSEACVLACVSRQLRRLASAPSVWQALCKRHTVVPAAAPAEGWRAEFVRRTLRLRRERSLAHQRRVLRAQSAIQLRLEEEARLSRELRAESKHHAELSSRLQQHARYAELPEGHRVWVPSAVRSAAFQASQLRSVEPVWALRTTRQQLALSESRQRQLARMLRARRAEAGRQQEALEAATSALP